MKINKNKMQKTKVYFIFKEDMRINEDPFFSFIFGFKNPSGTVFTYTLFNLSEYLIEAAVWYAGANSTLKSINKMVGHLLKEILLS